MSSLMMLPSRKQKEMRQYHYIMQIVWLISSAAIVISSTWMGFQEGFDKWWMMYLFLLATVLQYFRHKIQYKKITNIGSDSQQTEKKQ